MRGLRPTRRAWALLALIAFAVGIATGPMTYYDYETPPDDWDWCPTRTCDPWDRDLETDHPTP